MSIFVVSGAPGSGKSTYVQQNATQNDIIVDLDEIASSLRVGEKTHGDYGAVFNEAMKVRESLLQSIKSGGKWENAYVVTTVDENDLAKQLGAEIVQMSISRDECKKRVMQDGTRKDKDRYLNLVDQWYDKREKYVGAERVIKMETNENISDIEVMRGIIAEMNGVPAELLTGETVAEIKAQADALKDWKGSTSTDDGNGVKTPRDRFVSWMSGESCVQPDDGGAMPEPDAPRGKYPNVKDGGELTHAPNMASAKDQFTEYFNSYPFSRY